MIASTQIINNEFFPSSFQPLTIITKRSILDVEAALDPPLLMLHTKKHSVQKEEALSLTVAFTPGFHVIFHVI